MIRDQILYGLLKFNALTKNALHLLTSAPHSIDKSLLYLLKNELIKENYFIERDSKNSKKIIFYTLTPNGVRSLPYNEEIAKLHPWVDQIPPFDQEEIFYYTKGEAPELIRYLRMTEIAFMGELLNYEVPPMSFRKVESSLSLQDVAKKDTAKPAKQIPKEERNLSDEVVAAYSENNKKDNDVEFIPSREVKKDIIKKTLNPNETASKEWINKSRDTIMGRYAGIFRKGNRALLVYSAPFFGMRWPSNMVNNDKIALSQWCTLNNCIDEKTPSAAIFVRNPDHFKNIVLDRKKKRTTSKSTTDLGEGFDKFYAIPLSYDGMSLLNSILNNTTQNEMDYMESCIIDKDYSINDRDDIISSKLYPLISTKGVFMMNLSDMNIKNLYTLLAQSSNEQEESDDEKEDNNLQESENQKEENNLKEKDNDQEKEIQNKPKLGAMYSDWQEQYFYKVLPTKLATTAFSPDEEKPVNKKYFGINQGKAEKSQNSENKE